MIVNINKQNYNVNDDEFNLLIRDDLCNLKIPKNLNIFERLIALVKELANVCKLSNLVIFNTTHGGFMPINLSHFFQNIYLVNTSQNHINNIKQNIDSFKVTNVHIISLNNDDLTSINILTNLDNVLILDLYNEINRSNDSTVLYNIFFNMPNNILLDSDTHKTPDRLNANNINNINKQFKETYSTTYNLTKTNYHIHIRAHHFLSFTDNFKSFLPQNNTLCNNAIAYANNPIELEYDNLINLCMIVKDAGPQFEDTLIRNMPYFDTWTILDTGSTDETLEIINRVLVGKKRGNLYQEPFVDFKVSRNRCLDLAGKDCKYLMMLDDTYVVRGPLREYLEEVRGDQRSDSFCIYINSYDSQYASNRICKSDANLRYIFKIHEVIQDYNNIAFMLPNYVNIEDKCFDYMEKRTAERKKKDLELLFEELNENMDNPRTYYYIAQTYILLRDYQKAFDYYRKRVAFNNSGFPQERIDAAFESARIANFNLNLPWEKCKELYEECFKMDETRPECMYYIGIHYYINNDAEMAYEYLKKAFEIGFPLHCQYSLKPTLSFHFVPKFLCYTCFYIEDFKLGEKACDLFLKNNGPDSEDYSKVLQHKLVFQKLNSLDNITNINNTISNTTSNAISNITNISNNATSNITNISNNVITPCVPEKQIICFVADGGFNKWSGSSILNIGVGGSETYIIEMSRYVKKHYDFDVYVFCNCEDEEIFEGVKYRHLDTLYSFLAKYYIHSCIVSRYTEYLPLMYNCYVENVFLVLHDLVMPSNIVFDNPKLKKIICLSEWHEQQAKEIYNANLSKKIAHLYYGINNNIFELQNKIGHNEIERNVVKERYSFIYSSFPNRGLIVLLKMWKQIYNKQPKATLHIYSDVNGKWVNDNYPEQMVEIRNLLDEYMKTENSMGIRYYGWVDKKTLANAWKKADIWLYPCIFLETFCLTALEAAISKTLVFTNNLGALQNTVSNRGIVIDICNNLLDDKWINSMLDKIYEYIDDKPSATTLSKMEQLINTNYKWAINMTWENQAKKLMDTFILPNNIEHKNMYNWLFDLPEGTINNFYDLIDNFKKGTLYKNNNLNNIKTRILEIGTYSGTSLIEFVKNIPNSIGIGIDKWDNYEESTNMKSKTHFIKDIKVENSFYKNAKTSGVSNRIIGIKGDSQEILIKMSKNNDKFDIIYVDGSHLSFDAYADIILAWDLLKNEGYLLIDDYIFNIKNKNINDTPFYAVNYFLEKYIGKYEIIVKNYRVFLKKL